MKTKQKIDKINKNLFIIVSTVLLLIFLIGIASAEDSGASYCCEKTLSGAWCQNQPIEQCDSNFKTVPSSCDSTSYCKRGCCFDSQEGLCMENTPQRICEASNATWADSPECNIIQCQQGCCILGNQGAFVTLTRCKQLSGFYGLTTDFRSGIQNEVTCISTAQGKDTGACVMDNGRGGKTCKFELREKCTTAGSTDNNINISGNQTGGASLGFYKDILCTAPELGTECGKTKNTVIIEGKDEVYYTDTCNNRANIYDSSRYDDPQYWRNVYKKSESCGAGSSNAGSKTCGNCDYFLGSIGKKYSGILNKPEQGDYICVSLSCANGKKHGESWCVSDSPTGEGQDTVGSRYYKQICLNNEIITEPCADYRGQICIENSISGFSEAACRTNRWGDCTQQKQKSDCENINQRECLWIENYYLSSSGQVTKSTNDSNNDGNQDDPTPDGLCVPNYPPGFQFWGSSSSSAVSSGNATTPGFGSSTPSFGSGYINPSTGTTSAASSCSIGNSAITIKWEKTKHPLVPGFLEGILGTKNEEEPQCTQNCQYLTEEDKNNENISQATVEKWAQEMNGICYKLGDCGGYINWVGTYTDGGYAAYFNNRRLAGSGGAQILEATTTSNSNTGNATTPTFTNPTSTGFMIKDWINNIIK